MNLPKWLSDILTTAILPLAKLLGKNGLVDLLNNMKAKNPNWYGTIVIVGYRVLVVQLKPLADKTPQDWDNDSLDIVISAIEKSAEDNGIELPDVTIVAAPVLPPPPVV